MSRGIRELFKVTPEKNIVKFSRTFFIRDMEVLVNLGKEEKDHTIQSGEISGAFSPQSPGPVFAEEKKHL